MSLEELMQKVEKIVNNDFAVIPGDREYNLVKSPYRRVDVEDLSQLNQRQLDYVAEQVNNYETFFTEVKERVSNGSLKGRIERDNFVPGVRPPIYKDVDDATADIGYFASSVVLSPLIALGVGLAALEDYERRNKKSNSLSRKLIKATDPLKTPAAYVKFGVLKSTNQLLKGLDKLALIRTPKEEDLVYEELTEKRGDILDSIYG